MSLEAAVKELTAAMEQNNALLAKVVSGAAGKAAKASTDDAAPAANKGGGKGAGKGGKAKKPSVDDIRKAFQGYLDVEDKSEREERADKVRAILQELGAGKATEIEEDDRAKAIGWIEQLSNGETPDFMGDDGGDGDEGGSLI